MEQVQERRNGMKLRIDAADDRREAIRRRFSNFFSQFADIRRSMAPEDWKFYAAEWPICGRHRNPYIDAWRLWNFIESDYDPQPFQWPLSFFADLSPEEFSPPNLANVAPGVEEHETVIAARAQFWLAKHLPRSPIERQWLIDNRVAGR
jgi:hypothetical protein